MNKRYVLVFGISLLVIFLDQVSKLLVDAYMIKGLAGQIVLMGDWLKLHYTTNPGMAFGLRLGDSYGKLLLTIFRFLAMFAIVYYLVSLVKNREPKGLQFCVALVLGGAVGNLIDSMFYGIWLDNAPHGSPYAFLHGQVVDMVYIDIWEGILPKWVPIFGGEYYAFWPIFNIADASIFVGILSILLFQKRFFKEEDKKSSPSASTE